MVGNNWNQLQEDIIDWYKVLESIYEVQEKALIGAV